MPATHQERRRRILEECPSIKELEGASGTNWWGVALGLSVVALQSTCAALSSGSWTMCLALAATVGPYFDATVLAIMHEATHFLVFKRRTTNRLFSIMVNTVMVMPISEIFRQHHHAHHKGLSDPVLDVDIPLPFEVKLVGNSALRKALWLGFNMIILPARALARLPVHVDRFLLLNWACCIGFGAVALLLGGLQSLVFLVASTLFSQGLHPANSRQLEEHLYDGAHMKQGSKDDAPGTYSYYGVANLWTLNVGYHQEHHDFPAVPCYLLPEVRRRAGKGWYPDQRAFRDRGIWTITNFIFNPKISLADFGA